MNFIMIAVMVCTMNDRAIYECNDASYDESVNVYMSISSIKKYTPFHYAQCTAIVGTCNKKKTTHSGCIYTLDNNGKEYSALMCPEGI